MGKSQSTQKNTDFLLEKEGVIENNQGSTFPVTQETTQLVNEIFIKEKGEELIIFQNGEENLEMNILSLLNKGMLSNQFKKDQFLQYFSDFSSISEGDFAKISNLNRHIPKLSTIRDENLQLSLLKIGLTEINEETFTHLFFMLYCYNFTAMNIGSSPTIYNLKEQVLQGDLLLLKEFLDFKFDELMEEGSHLGSPNKIISEIKSIYAIYGGIISVVVKRPQASIEVRDFFDYINKYAEKLNKYMHENKVDTSLIEECHYESLLLVSKQFYLLYYSHADNILEVSDEFKEREQQLQETIDYFSQKKIGDDMRSENLMRDKDFITAENKLAKLFTYRRLGAEWNDKDKETEKEAVNFMIKDYNRVAHTSCQDPDEVLGDFFDKLGKKDAHIHFYIKHIIILAHYTDIKDIIGLSEKLLNMFDKEDYNVDYDTGFEFRYFKKALYRAISENIGRYKNESCVDRLTGLLNRGSHDRILSKEFTSIQRNVEKKEGHYILMDIDNFKYINDTYGHTLGDEVLRRISIILRDILRDSDYIFRYGGEEIAIYIEEELEGALLVCEKMRSEIENKLYKVIENEINYKESERITVSIGMNSMKNIHEIEGHSLHHVVDGADKAMYSVKDTGKNSYRMYNGLMEED